MFNERLRELRKAKDLSQEELAKHLQLARTTLTMYENGQREPDLSTICRIANFFNVSLDYLLGRKEEETKITPSSANPSDRVVGQITELINDLSPKAQKELANYAQFLHTKQIFEGAGKESSATSEDTA